MKPLSAVDRTVTLSVLVLLVFSGCGVSQTDVGVLTIKYMTWGDGGTPTSTPQVTVCSDEELDPDAATFRLTVKTSDDSQIAFDGVKLDANCTTFTDDDLGGPASASTTYEVTVYSGSDVELQSGAVTYAFPLSQGTKFDCGSTQYGRFVITDNTAFSVDASCSYSTGVSCYVTATDSDDLLCVLNLDSPNLGFSVCVPSQTPVTADAGITNVSLTYTEDSTSGGRFTVNPFDTSEGNILELLSSSDNNLAVQCESAVCTFDVGSPDTKVYQLCGVYVDASNNVVSASDFQFQDLNLVVEPTSTTVDFFFTNKAADGSYNIYGGDNSLDPFSDNPTFTLDCSRFDSDSVCSGFFIDDLPTYVGVFYASNAGGNAVIASVPASSRGATGNATTSHNSRGAQKTPGSA